MAYITPKNVYIVTVVRADNGTKTTYTAAITAVHINPWGESVPLEFNRRPQGTPVASCFTQEVAEQIIERLNRQVWTVEKGLTGANYYACTTYRVVQMSGATALATGATAHVLKETAEKICAERNRRSAQDWHETIGNGLWR